MTTASFTNHPFTQNCMKAFPIFKWVITVLALAFAGYVGLLLEKRLFTRAEGEALEQAAYLKVDADKLEKEIELVQEDVVEIEKHMHGFSIEQRVTNDSLTELKVMIKDLHDDRER